MERAYIACCGFLIKKAGRRERLLFVSSLLPLLISFSILIGVFRCKINLRINILRRIFFSWVICFCFPLFCIPYWAWEVVELEVSINYSCKWKILNLSKVKTRKLLRSSLGYKGVGVDVRRGKKSQQDLYHILFCVIFSLQKLMLSCHSRLQEVLFCWGFVFFF